MIDRIRKPVEAEFLQFRQEMVSAFSSDNQILSHVSAYISQSQGKQFRPIFLLLSAAIAGGVSAHSITMAAALEMLHTASLLHDDVVDEADQRRARRSINAAWDNKTAILSGDFYLSKVIALVASTGDCRLMQGLAETGLSLSDGELVQLAHAGRLDTDEPTYFDIIGKKTASMFGFSAYAGALTGGADEKTASLLKQYGEYLGCIFQIRDDIFDYFESSEVGKPVGADLREGKLTLPLIYALKSPVFSAPLRKLLSGLNDMVPEQVKEVCRLVVESGGVEYATRKMQEIKVKALELLHHFTDSPYRQSLALCLDYAMDRHH